MLKKFLMFALAICVVCSYAQGMKRTRHPVRDDISVYTIDATVECVKLGNPKLFNTLVLGGYLKVCPVVTLENVFEGLKRSLPERAWKMLPQNEEAIRHGAEIICKVR